VAEEPSSEPTAKNYSLREELEQNRGILRRLCGRFEQLDTEESCGVEMAEGEKLQKILLFGTLSGALPKSRVPPLRYKAQVLLV
jgi:hypothetical protein